jgi:hypothetical protein
MLVELFLRRLVENDLVAEDADRRELLAFVASALIAVSTIVSTVLATRYLLRPLQSRGWTAIVSLDDTFLWTGASMLAMAFVALAAWDGLSLDARDVEVLGTLPVAHRSVVAAQVTSVAILALGCAIGLNLVPTLIGPIVRVQRLPVDALGLLTLTAAHGTAALSAGFVGFGSIYAVRELARAALGSRLFAAASGALQGALVVLCATSLLLLPGAAARVERQWLASGATLLPPLWFVGLHETMSGEALIGIPATDAPAHSPRRSILASAEAGFEARYRRHQPAFVALAVRAAWSMAIVAGLALGAWAWNNRRLPAPASGGPPRGRAARSRWLRHLVAPAPAMRAGFDFALHALARSGPHRVIVASAAGVSIACATAALWGAGGAEPTSDPPIARVFAGQALVVFVMLSGFRRATRRPVSPDALVTFVLSGIDDDRQIREGARRAGIVAVGLPALALLAPAHVLLVGAQAAAWHLVVGASLLLLVAEAAVARDAGLPFAGPAEARDHQVVRAVIMAVVALQVATALGWLESIAWRTPAGAAGLPALIAALWLALAWHHARTPGRSPGSAAAVLTGATRLDLGE